jgi:hypothetical protein
MPYDRQSIKRWRRTCHKEIDRLGACGDADHFRATALVAMSVYAFGTDVTTLSDLSGQSPAFVRTVLKRLRQQRVLSGQCLRVNWNEKGLVGMVSLCCDLLVAVGEVMRPVDPKRSAALKGKAGRKRGAANRKRIPLTSGASYSPKVTPVPNQLYQIAPNGREALRQRRTT